MTETGRVVLAARVFSLAAIISVTIILGGPQTGGAVGIVVLAVIAEALSLSRRIPDGWIAVLEGGIAAVLMATSYPSNEAVLPYLMIPVLIGSLSAGLVGLVRVMVVEVLSLSVAWWVLVGVADRELAGRALTWLVCAAGLGLLGRSFRKVVDATTTEGSYRSALDLIKQLHGLSGRLTSGLDAVSVAEGVLARFAEQFPLSHGAVYVREDSGAVVPLRFGEGTSRENFADAEDSAVACWSSGKRAVEGRRVTIPLRTDSHVVAVLVGDCIGVPEPRAVTALADALAPRAVQLSAALLFGDVRDSATSQERQRLAREVHDGVAQDVASLGYLVDTLTETVTEPEQLGQLQQLRHEVTRVVTELRHSVFDLRTEVNPHQGLGQSISTLARHIGSHSDLTVHVTLDEAPTRLRTEVEAQMLRIAQEAMNNARKHSAAENLWVSCAVQPPMACLEVVDDGVGLGQGRADSHGLNIMRERATRIGATFCLDTPARDGRGTRVLVRLGTLEEEMA